jgi:hypothetical protein
VENYVPPVSPAIVLRFKGTAYVPPVSPDIRIVFGQDDDENPAQGMQLSNFMLFLPM